MERDLVIVTGVEPSMRWKSFSQELLDLADDLDTPKALSLINNWAKQSINCDVVSDTEEFLKVLDALLGLKF